MNKRYAKDSDTTLILSKASFLDPRFKRLAHICTFQQKETITSITDEIIAYLESNVHVYASEPDTVSLEEPPSKRSNINVLE